MKDSNSNFDPFANLVLDEYEQEIEDSIPEDAPLEKVPEETLEFFRIAAQKYAEKAASKRINIRVNSEDLAKVKVKAKNHRIPYQTLLGSVIHKYAKGEIVITL